ncbi:MAG: hypothetical protein V3S55_09750 [Nitrospiraceae bacterium]
MCRVPGKAVEARLGGLSLVLARQGEVSLVAAVKARPGKSRLCPSRQVMARPGASWHGTAVSSRRARASHVRSSCGKAAEACPGTVLRRKLWNVEAVVAMQVQARRAVSPPVKARIVEVGQGKAVQAWHRCVELSSGLAGPVTSKPVESWLGRLGEFWQVEARRVMLRRSVSWRGRPRSESFWAHL